MLTAKSLTAILNLGTGATPDNNCALCVNGPGTYTSRPFTLDQCLNPGRKACLGTEEAPLLPKMVS